VALRSSGPKEWSEAFFSRPVSALASFWRPLVGPLVSVVSFVCSIGNAPLAAVLWNGGISFGGVVAFIFADLIVIPILNIYRKYYRLTKCPNLNRIGCAIGRTVA